MVAENYTLTTRQLTENLCLEVGGLQRLSYDSDACWVSQHVGPAILQEFEVYEICSIRPLVVDGEPTGLFMRALMQPMTM